MGGKSTKSSIPGVFEMSRCDELDDEEVEWLVEVYENEPILCGEIGAKASGLYSC